MEAPLAGVAPEADRDGFRARGAAREAARGRTARAQCTHKRCGPGHLAAAGGFSDMRMFHSTTTPNGHTARVLYTGGGGHAARAPRTHRPHSTAP